MSRLWPRVEDQRGLDRRSGPSLRRLTATALVVAAVLPALGIGILVSARLGTALQEDAQLRAEQAALTAKAFLARSMAELDRLTLSYATWPQLAAAVAAGELDAVRSDVLQFLVDQGRLTGAVLLTDERSIAAGRPSLTAELAQLAAAATTGTTVRTLAGAVYLVSVATLGAPGATPQATPPPSPAGVDPATARLGFARRLDAEFAVELRGLTGFDVAVVDAAGRTTVATNPDALVALGPLGAVPPTGERAGFLVARVPLPPEGGSDGSTGSSEEATPPAAGELVLSAELSAAQAATGQLPVIVAALAGTTALAAFVLALWLSRVLGRRLAAVHDGLVAIAEGRRPPPLATSNDDPVDRLVEAVGRLLAALERRETTVRRAFEAIAAVPVDRSPAEVASTLLDAADDIFGLRWSAIVEADGTVFARSARAPTDLPGAMVPASGGAPADHQGIVLADLFPRPRPESADLANGSTVGAAEGRGAGSRRLIAVLETTEPGARAVESTGDEPSDRPGAARPASRPAWSPADEATLRLMALLIGSAIEDAERYATAAERALRLDRLNQLQRQFLRSISHNLRTPLATIGLAVEDLAEAVATDDHLAQRTQAIRSATARLGRLVDQVLTLSRLEAGTMDLAAEPLVPAHVVAAVWRELDVGRSFRIDDRTGGRRLLVDRRALEQICWNLLDNAVRYAPTGPVEVRIVLRPSDDGSAGERGSREPAPSSKATTASSELEIAFLDEGPGVPAGERGRIFHRFVRGSTAGHQAGTGLGLSLARSLARLMGGDLVYVDRGSGTSGACFALRLPVPSEEEAHGSRPLRHEPTAWTMTNGAPGVTVPPTRDRLVS